MKKFWIQIILLTVIIFVGFYSYQNPNLFPSLLSDNQPLTQTQIKVGQNIINIETAKTPSERAKGLGGRESIATNSGMLFVFDSPKKYQFWMKDMKFPIDMIFINNGQVVDFLKNVPAPTSNQKDSDLPRYQPIADMDMVLEVQNGYIEKNNVSVGDSVAIIK